MIANVSLKLHLRRLRSDAEGSRRIATIGSLLDGCEAIARSLAWLGGGLDTIDPVEADAALPLPHTDTTADLVGSLQ